MACCTSCTPRNWLYCYTNNHTPKGDQNRANPIRSGLLDVIRYLAPRSLAVPRQPPRHHPVPPLMRTNLNDPAKPQVPLWCRPVTTTLSRRKTASVDKSSRPLPLVTTEATSMLSTQQMENLPTRLRNFLCQPGSRPMPCAVDLHVCDSSKCRGTTKLSKTTEYRGALAL